MTRETADGRLVYLCRTRDGFIVRWGRTVVAKCRDLEEALNEIIGIYASGA